MRKLTLLLPVALITACTVNVVNPVGVEKVVVTQPSGISSAEAKPMLAPMDAGKSLVESSEVISATPEPTPQPTPKIRYLSFIHECSDWTDISDCFQTVLVNVNGVPQKKEICSVIIPVYAVCTSGGVSCDTAKWNMSPPVKDGVFMSSYQFGERCLSATGSRVCLNIEKTVSPGSVVVNVEYETATASLRFDIDHQSENGPMIIRTTEIN